MDPYVSFKKANFSKRVIDLWNELLETTVMAPTLNSWYLHPHNFDPWCYIPGEKARNRPTYPNTSAEAIRRNVSIGVSFDLSTPTRMICIGTYVES